MITPSLHLGKRLRYLRIERGFSQAELARVCGISPSRLSELENHPQNNITYNTIKKLAWGLQMTTDHFIYCIERENGKYVPYHLTPNGILYPMKDREDNPKKDHRRLTTNHW